MAEIIGTFGNDSLNGTGDPDSIFGLGGDDQLIGLGGDDLLTGGGDDVSSMAAWAPTCSAAMPAAIGCSDGAARTFSRAVTATTS